ncbi:prepilin-type N-terminal cleavage/methylation domain-containing protein [Parelusimicrobium proximum]|uniref:type IV pilin protein n=1 Tax=Parelusimicrobium proximum TaxID=3228953 RepID=UPI003D169D23
MKKGFTLIELLVVVLIIAILAAVALPQYTAAVERSRASEALLNLKAIGGAMDRYYLANDEYTLNFEDLDVNIGSACTGKVCTHGKYTYQLRAYNLGAYKGGAVDTSQLTFLFYFDDSTADTNYKRGMFGCHSRNEDKWRKVCLSMAGPNYLTSNEGTISELYVWK